MHLILAALLAFGILTLWIPADWPVAVFQVGAFAICVLALWRRPPERLPYPIVPLLVAVLWGVAQLRLGITAYPFDTKMAVARWATFLAIFLAGYCLLRSREVRRWFRSALVWLAFVVSIWAILGYTNGVMGPIVYHNHWAVFVEVMLPMALFEALRRERNSWIYIGIAGTLYASVILSSSRAGTVLATSEVLAIGLLMFRRSAKLLPLLLVLAALPTAGVWHRFTQFDATRVRGALNVASLHMIESHPLTGTGLGTWPTVYPRYAVADFGAFANQAHDDWAQFTAEGGVLFGILAFSLFVWAFRPAVRSIWGLGVIAVFLHAFVDYPFSRPALGSLPMLILGMLV